LVFSSIGSYLCSSSFHPMSIRFQFFNLCFGHCLPNSTFLFCYLLALISSFYLLDSTYQDPIFPHLHLIQCFSWLSASWILSFLASFSFVVFPQFWNFMYPILHRIHTVECLCEFNFLGPYSSHYSFHPLFSLKFNIFRSSLSWPSWKSMDALDFDFLESSLWWLSFHASVLDLTIFYHIYVRINFVPSQTQLSWNFHLLPNPTLVKISSSLVHISTNDFFFRFHFIHTFLQIQLS
jgi:hypothetical protein